MGSSLPTPASVPQDSSTLHDQHSLADKRLLHEKDGSPVELAHITSHGAKVELGDAQSQATTMLGTSRCLKGKEKEWTLPVRRKGPLRLLDLPVDILKMIIKEVKKRLRPFLSDLLLTT